MERLSPTIQKAARGVDPGRVFRNERAFQGIPASEDLDQILVVPHGWSGSILQRGAVLGKELLDELDFLGWRDPGVDELLRQGRILDPGRRRDRSGGRLGERGGAWLPGRCRSGGRGRQGRWFRSKKSERQRQGDDDPADRDPRPVHGRKPTGCPPVMGSKKVPILGNTRGRLVRETPSQRASSAK